MSLIEKKEEIKELLRQGECEFIFIKANGDEREAVGTLHPDYLPQLEESQMGGSTETDETVTYWDIDAKDWRRFRIDSLVSDPELV